MRVLKQTTDQEAFSILETSNIHLTSFIPALNPEGTLMRRGTGKQGTGLCTGARMDTSCTTSRASVSESCLGHGHLGDWSCS